MGSLVVVGVLAGTTTSQVEGGTARVARAPVPRLVRRPRHARVVLPGCHMPSWNVPGRSASATRAVFGYGCKKFRENFLVV